MSKHFDGDAYLERIGLSMAPEVSPAFLAAMHTAQVHRLPFENLDIHLGRGVNVEPAAIFEKIVTGRRGGYCFELNGLFLQALQHFGFNARALLARVHFGPEPGGRTHQVSLVSIEGDDWIADVGFGSMSLRQPMLLRSLAPVDQVLSRHRLQTDATWGCLMQAENEGEFSTLYSFDLEHVCRGDIVTGNWYTSTSPEVFFTQMKVVSLHTETGRKTLTDINYQEIGGTQAGTKTLTEQDEYLALLASEFGIELGADEAELKLMFASGP